MATLHNPQEYRKMVLLRGLRLEHKTNGKMRLTRGPTCLSIVKRENGFKGNRKNVLNQFERLLGLPETD